MNAELQLKVQAYLDGELSAGEAREVTDLLAQDAQAGALLAELKNTRRALKVFEAELQLPESREFYWSKIQREIARPEKLPTHAAPAGFAVWWRRLLAPAGAVAALVIAVMLTWHQTPPTGHFVPETEMALAESDAFTYRDYPKGVTLVWLSYPAENEFAELVPGARLDQR